MKNITESEKEYLNKLFLYLKKELGYTQSQIAIKLNITEATMSRYIHGIRYPGYEIILKIYKEFNISQDIIENYLLNDNNIKEELDDLYSKIKTLKYEHILEIKKTVDLYSKIEKYEEQEKIKKYKKEKRKI